MKRIRSVVVIVLCAILVFTAGVRASEKRKVMQEGETALSASQRGLNAEVRIRTTKASTRKENSLGAGTSTVESLAITVNGKAVWVPPSSYCDLTDVVDAQLDLSAKNGQLVLTGGDASESYIVKIDFDREAVTRRRVLPGIAEHVVTQDTRYRTYKLPYENSPPSRLTR